MTRQQTRPQGLSTPLASSLDTKIRSTFGRVAPGIRRLVNKCKGERISMLRSQHIPMRVLSESIQASSASLPLLRRVQSLPESPLRPVLESIGHSPAFLTYGYTRQCQGRTEQNYISIQTRRDISALGALVASDGLKCMGNASPQLDLRRRLRGRVHDVFAVPVQRNIQTRMLTNTEAGQSHIQKPSEQGKSPFPTLNYRTDTRTHSHTHTLLKHFQPCPQASASLHMFSVLFSAVCSIGATAPHPGTPIPPCGAGDLLEVPLPSSRDRTTHYVYVLYACITHSLLRSPSTNQPLVRACVSSLSWFVFDESRETQTAPST
ncbi:hypothetical protein BGZ63DRAFT_401890 [Mariannaea sp. PMI_226]|nr:hypothetical protein BGZ63DRAFT_401890 [Mariannaea sp. PMI_226]